MLNIEGHKNMNKTVQKRPSQRKMYNIFRNIT